MLQFAPGQRWISAAEPELGLGTVLRVDARQVQVVFAATGTVRHYARQSAPLARAAFHAGDAVQVGGALKRVEGVVDRNGVLHYKLDGAELPEGALDDVQAVSRADERLIAGRVDRNVQFDFRVEALARRAYARQDAGFGVLSARIEPIPHQLRVAQIAASRRPPRVLLADEVGLGKTIEACLIVSRLIAAGRAGRVLVLVPEALVYQWFVELLRRFNLAFAIFDEERVESIELEGDGRNPFLDEQLVLTDLAFLVGNPAHAGFALQGDWDLVVIDEAHHLAWSPEATSPEYELAEKLAAVSPGLILLTATPEQLGRTGHFARLRLLDPARFHDLAAYQQEAAGYVELSALAEKLQQNDALDAAQQSLLEKLLAAEADSGAVALLGRDDAHSREELLRRLVDRHGTGRVMFRNRRAVVGGFPQRLPEIETIAAPPDGDGSALVARLTEEFLGDIAQPPFVPPLSYATDPRLAWLVNLVESNPKDKFLLICRAQAKLHALDEALRTRTGVPLARFHEGLGIVQRDRAAAYFAQPDGARLMLCSEIGSEGRNFQFAQHLILWDLPLDPDLTEQRIGRLDRIGQTGAIRIHHAIVAGSAQAALARWYDEGLDAFRASPEDGRELLKRFGERVVSTALACARAESECDALLDALINETRAAHESLAASIAQGRDRLLELATSFAPGADTLHDALARADHDPGVDEFIARLFEQFGVHVDELGPRSVSLDPEMLTTEAFPGLENGARAATFDRRAALSREDLLFLRLDHPMVTGALDLLLSAETGNAAFAIDDALPPRTAMIEAVFVLECIAPGALAVDRFLPPAPLRVVIDTRLAERSAYVVSARTSQRADDRTVDATRYRKLLVRLVPPMLEMAKKHAEARTRQAADEALAAARAALGAEIERLVALARVNPAVRADEITAAQRELAGLERVLPAARARLDSLRFIASADFLALRG